MAYGKTVTIYFDNGTPDGIITASLSNWNGVCIKAPRSEIPRKDYEELDAPGVYFLVCTDTDDGQDAVYIGEAENVRARLKLHIQDYSSGRETYYWQNAVVFTGSELNKTLIRYLEHNLTMKAKAAKRYIVLTKNTYSKTVIKRHEKAAMDEFIDNIQILLSALNYRIIDPLYLSNEEDTSVNEDFLYFSVKAYFGKGYFTTDEKFVLKAGANISPFESKSCPASISKRRKNAVESGLLKDWVTTEDMLFSSSSAAAAFILGYPFNGPKNWKNSEGINVGELRKKN